MSDSREKEACVITGVAGFVGSHLAERLLSLGCSVVGVDNFFSGRRENMDGFKDNPAFSFYERSIAEPRLLSQLNENHPGLSTCFHLAAIVSVPYSVEHPEQTMDLNYHSTVSLLAEAQELGFRKFVFAGSAAEYGDDERLPLREEFASEKTRHLSPYGRAKFLASQRVGASPIGVALRFFNIYGPRQDPNSPYSGVISRFSDMVRSGRPLTIFGDGQQSRDFVYVSDVVEAYVRAAGLDESGSPLSCGIYNIGSGKSTSILDLAGLIRDLSGCGQPITFQPERAGDIRHSIADSSAFFRAAGWTPSVSLHAGLKTTLKG